MNFKTIDLKKIKIKIIIFLLILLAIIYAVFYTNKENEKRVVEIHGVNIPSKSLEEYVGSLSNIFTGVVVGVDKAYNIKDDMPYTDYVVNVADNIKGNLENKILVRQIGGEFKDVVVESDTPNLKIGNLYLFNTRASENDIKNGVYWQNTSSESLVLLSEKPGNKKENIEISRNNKKYIELLKAYANEIVNSKTKKLKVSGNFFKDLSEEKKSEIKERIENIEKKFRKTNTSNVVKKEEKENDLFKNLSIEERNKIKNEKKILESKL